MAALSPGRVAKKRSAELDRQRERQRQLQKTKEFKRSRLVKKVQRSLTTFAKEVREGATYKSNIGRQKTLLLQLLVTDYLYYWASVLTHIHAVIMGLD